MKLIAIYFLLLATVAIAQTPKKIPHRAVDQDHSLCVNADGTDKCATLEGTTGDFGLPAALSVFGEITQNEGQTAVSVVETASGGSAVIGSFNSCSSPEVNLTSVRYWKFNINNWMVQQGRVVVLTNNSNATCNTSVVVTLPAAFNAIFFPVCSAGQFNTGSDTPASSMNCKVVYKRNTWPQENTLVMTASDQTTYTSGNWQRIDFGFIALGSYTP